MGTVRAIEAADNSAIRNIIRTVMPEFGASGQGFAIHDAEVEDMYSAYSQKRHAYFVYEEEGKILGGGGIGPLKGGDTDTCELKKMYFLSEGRGKGLGQKVLTACLEAARNQGYKTCYLETFNTMNQAMKLYERNGFKKIGGPCGSTGHFACDVFYSRPL
ncbi:MAG: GNAT family N-acetyltransferase [Cyclobacteriaceae bacterium]